MRSEAVTTSYARWAPIYDKTFGRITQAARRSTVDYINAIPAHDVLEVGVGTGLALPHYARDRAITGIDFSGEMLAKARTRVAREALNHVAALRQMDARNLDFPDASFDAVAAMHIISVVPEPQRVMAEMTRVLRPGGRLVVTNHFASESGPLAHIERGIARFADVIGWHSDFPLEIVVGTPGLRMVEQRREAPIGMMTMVVLEKL
ncbi:class I SAM-dependent methyltransferase [Roseivivax sp. CAU 1761]